MIWLKCWLYALLWRIDFMFSPLSFLVPVPLYQVSCVDHNPKSGIIQQKHHFPTKSFETWFKVGFFFCYLNITGNVLMHDFVQIFSKTNMDRALCLANIGYCYSHVTCIHVTTTSIYKNIGFTVKYISFLFWNKIFLG